MATDFSKSVITADGIQPSTVNTPVDIRTRVETEAYILNIPLTYVGMIVYVEVIIMKLKIGLVGYYMYRDRYL